MDGNTLLEDARVLANAESPDALIFDGASVIYASGNALHRLGGKPVKEYAAPVTALAISPDGIYAVGFNSGAVIVGRDEIAGFNCPAALAFDGGSLLVCNGSESFAPEDWVKDLMRRKSSGSVWRVNLAAKERQCLARSLAYPNGIVSDGNRIVFSESWKHRLSSIASSGGAVTPVLQHLPAYPCRIMPAFDGYLLALFAPLNRLVEFVLLEDDYREDMVREIDSRYWGAP